MNCIDEDNRTSDDIGLHRPKPNTCNCSVPEAMYNDITENNSIEDNNGYMENIAMDKQTCIVIL